MDLIYLFKSLMRKKWLIIFSTLLAVVLAFVLTTNQKRLYRSVSQMATGFTTSSQEVRLRQDEGFNIYEIDVKFSNLTESFRAPRVLGMLAYSLMIHDLENPTKQYRPLDSDEKQKEAELNLNKAQVLTILKQKYNSEKLLNSSIPEERKILELIKLHKYDLETMRKMMYVGRVARTDFIDIEYNSGNPELSAFVVNQVIAEFLRMHESSRAQINVQSTETLKKLVDQKKQELDEKMAALRTSGSLVDVSAETTSKLTQISTFEGNMASERSLLTTATLGLEEVNNKIAEMDRTNAKTTTGSTTSNQELLNLKNQMNSARNEYQNKGSNDQTLYDKWQKLRTEYNNKLASSASSNLPSTGIVTKGDLLQKKSDLEIQIKAAEQNIRDYESKIRELNNSVNAAGLRGATNMALTKELEFAQSEYENIKQRYDAAMNNKVATFDNFRQILYGQPAVEPEPSKRLIIIGLAGISMLVFVCILIIFIEYVDVSIKTPSQFLRTIGLKMVGVVNKINLQKSPLDNIFTIPNTDKKDVAIFREHLRKLRFEIENNTHRVYLVTSARKGEGKSTMIRALAHSLSLSRKKVLIIDTNFSDNTLTREFNAKPSLEEVSNSTKQYTKENIGKAISKTNINNVDIIGSTGGDYTPFEVLGDDNLLAHLDVLTQYDYIFMEGAPLNGRSDSRELLRYADTVISVVSARSSIKQTDKESIGFLQELNGKFTGAVLNYVELENIDL